MGRFVLSLAFALVVASGLAEKARYDNYQVYKITPRTQMEVVQLAQLSDANEFSFWNDPMAVNLPVNIMVAPHQRAQFEELLSEYQFDNELVIPNVQQLIDEDETVKRHAPKKMEWTSYRSLKDIYDWLDELAKTYKQVKVINGGKTYEGRDIRGIEINFGKNYTNVFLEAGIHAREWISPAATTWMVNQFFNSSSDPVLRQFNYIYFPVYNPDGYVYSCEKDRMWRKTRTPYKSGARTCYGADPNRNWDCHWNEVGASNDPCKETYAGPRAFSEVETRSMANYTLLRNMDRKSDIFLAYHSYSQLLMYPWGYTSKPTKEAATWSKIAAESVRALGKVHGTVFKYGQVSTTIYPVSGSSIEWYYDTLKPFIPFVYELRDTGRHGFLLPANQIIPSGQETLASLISILQQYKALKK